MPHDLSLSDLRRCFTEDDGALPDATVEGAGAQDWPSVLDLVRSRGWATRWLVDEDVPDDADEQELLRAGVALSVSPVPGVLVNFFPGEDVRFDVYRREIRDEASARVLGDVLRAVGTHLQRTVAVAYEGSAVVFLRYDPATDAFRFPDTTAGTS